MSLEGLEAIRLPGGLTVRVARRWPERRDGLSRLGALDPDTGLWILKCRSVHTIGMAFPLDLLWLGRDDELLDVAEDVPPGRLRTNLRARTVIEVNAGRGAAFAAAWAARTT